MVVGVFIIRCTYRAFFPNYYVDTEALVEAASAYQDHGKMEYTFSPTDDQPPMIIPLKGLPTGYAYLIVGMNHLTKKGKTSVFVLDCIALGIFLIAAFQLLKQIDTDTNKANLILLGYLGLSPTLLHPLPATDLFSLALLMASICFLLTFHSAGILLGELLLIATANIRFAYVPFCVIPLIVWGIFLWKYHSFSKAWRRLAPALILLFLYLGVGFLPKIIQGDLPFLDEQGGKIYVEHLLAMDTFPLKAFFYYNQTHLDFLSGGSPLITSSLQAIAYVLSLGILGLVIREWINWSKGTEKEASRAWLFGAISVTNIGLLCYMSLLTPPERDWLDFWTFVMDTRYFAPTQVLILFTFLSIINQKYSAFIRKT